MLEVFKVQYIDREHRDKINLDIPEWQKKVNEINLFYSNLLSKMHELLPEACQAFEYLEHGDPNDYAAYETYSHFNIPYKELYYTHYYIDTETLEIRDLESEGIVECSETDFTNKYGHNGNGKLWT